MNNFREWLSDNLRYIELILGIIAVIIGLFFGIRAIAGAISRGANTGKYNEDSIVAEAASNASLTKKASSGSVSTSSDASSAVSSASSAVSSAPDSSADTSSAAAEITPAADSVLAENAVPEVTELITSFYTALGNQDVAAVKTMADVLSDEEAAKITQARTKYSDVRVYTKPGPEGDGSSYVVYACYNYLNQNQSVALPGLSQMLVRKDGTGVFKIIYSAYDQTTSDYIDSLASDADVKALVEQVQNAYKSAASEEAAAEAAKNAAA